jgi:hypothetical protein
LTNKDRGVRLATEFREERRAGRNQNLFREVNEGINALPDRPPSMFFEERWATIGMDRRVSFALQTLENALGTLFAAGVIYIVGVLAGAITADTLILVLSGGAWVVMVVLVWRAASARRPWIPAPPNDHPDD